MKIITANEAAKLISNGMSLGLSGSSATCIVPDRIYEAIENRYLNFSEPKGLTLVHPQGQGNKDNTGMSRFAHPGLCKRVIGGHWGMSPKMGELAIKEELEAYNFPQGVLAQMMRVMAAHGPGVIK